MPDAPIDLWTTPGAVAIRRDVVLVTGPEALEFLQGQLSQDITGLAVDESAPSLLLQPTGKVDAWVRVTVGADDVVWLDVDEGHGEAVASRLGRFKLRTKVELEPATWSGFAVRGPGCRRPADLDPGVVALTAGWPGVDGFDLLSKDGPRTAPAGPLAGASDLERLRIEAGVPAMGAEITADTIPAELGQWLIAASVSFTKGCYTGQELVARIDSRGGNVPRPLRGLLVDGPPPVPGAAVSAEGRAVGQVTSAATSAALGSVALAPLARAVEVGALVEVAGVSATVAELPLR